MYAFMLLFRVIHVSLIYSPLKWKEDMINVLYSQNVGLVGLWHYIYNNIICTASVLFCK